MVLFNYCGPAVMRDTTEQTSFLIKCNYLNNNNLTSSFNLLWLESNYNLLISWLFIQNKRILNGFITEHFFSVVLATCRDTVGGSDAFLLQLDFKVKRQKSFFIPAELLTVFKAGGLWSPPALWQTVSQREKHLT